MAESFCFAVNSSGILWKVFCDIKAQSSRNVFGKGSHGHSIKDTLYQCAPAWCTIPT